MALFDITTAVAYDPADVTPAILEAIADATAAGGGIIYFPAGEHLVGDTVHVVGGQCLQFRGEGRASVLKRRSAEPDVAGVFVFEDCEGIVLERLAFDANGFQPPEGSAQRALVQFEAGRRLIIQDAWAFDTAPRQPPPDDEDGGLTHRYDGPHHVAFAFLGDGRDVTVSRCRLETLGIAVHGATLVRIRDNDLVAPVGHGVAVGALEDDDRREDIWIQGNRVIEPWRFAIVVADIPIAGPGLGPPPLRPTFPMRRIRIERNAIRKELGEWARGIVVGLLDDRPVSAESEGWVLPYLDIWVCANRVDVAPAEGVARLGEVGEGSTPAEERGRIGGVWLQTPVNEPGSDAVPTIFHGAIVRDNLVIGARSQDGAHGAGIRATNLRLSEVAGNGVYASDEGVVLAGDLLATHVHDNRVEVGGVPYRFDESSGRNDFGSNARLDFASQRTVWLWEGTDGSDEFLGGDLVAGGQGLIGRGHE